MSKLPSIVDEIARLHPKKDSTSLVETRISNAYSAAIKFMECVEQELDEVVAKEMIKRFFLATRNRDYKRIERGLKKLRKAKRNGKDPS